MERAYVVIKTLEGGGGDPRNTKPKEVCCLLYCSNLGNGDALGTLLKETLGNLRYFRTADFLSQRMQKLEENADNIVGAGGFASEVVGRMLTATRRELRPSLKESKRWKRWAGKSWNAWVFTVYLVEAPDFEREGQVMIRARHYRDGAHQDRHKVGSVKTFYDGPFENFDPSGFET